MIVRGTLLATVFACLAAPTLAVELDVAWEKSVEQAKVRARKEKKPIVVDFWAAWCGWCKVQDREIFAKEKFVRWSKDHVYLKLNTEDRGDGEKLAQKFQVYSLPTILVMDADGNELDRIPGYVPLDPFIERLKQIFEGKGELQTLSRKANPTAQELVRLASIYVERGNVDLASKTFARVIAKDPENKEGFSDEALYFLGQIARATGKIEDAKKHFGDYLKKYPNEPAAPDVRRFLGMLPGEKRSESGPTEKAKVARYDEVPGLDLGALPAAQRGQVLDRLNREMCTCGCEGDTIAQCIHVDPACNVAPKLAQTVLDEVVKRRAAVP